jgi:hypothetical protein
MENLEIEIGCVYFFKHIGLDPIKIGYSTNQSPINRFESFKTYAPFGAELIGFIMTEKSKELETLLHQKFSAKRLSGEWFNISKEEALECISLYSKIEDLQEMNNFQVLWAIKKSGKVAPVSFYNNFSFTKNDDFPKKVVLNKKEIIEIILCDKNELNEFMNKNKNHYKLFQLNGSVKKGHLLFTRE